MAGPVGDELDELPGRVERGQDAPGDLDVGELDAAPDVVGLSAITYEAPDGSRRPISDDKVRLLNRAFNECLTTSGKKILILPDLFGLDQKVSHGQVMIDFGLTSMEE